MASFVENVNKIASIVPSMAGDLDLIVQNIDAINEVTLLANDLTDIINNVIPNLAEILDADNNATIATTKADEALASKTQAGIYRDEAEAFNESKAFVVDTVEDLLTIPSSYTTAIVRDLNRGGTFIWSTTGTANGGTVFAGVSGYWIRQYSGAVDVKWFGATLKEVRSGNDTSVQNAINYCASNDIPLYDDFRFYQTSTDYPFTFPDNLILQGRDGDRSLNTSISSLERVVFVGNSLTDYVTDTSFTRHLAPKMANFMGGEHKELGYITLDDGTAGNGGSITDWKQKRYPYYISRNGNANITQFRGFSDNLFGTMPSKLSPDGAGMHIAIGTGTSATRVTLSSGGNPQFSWSKARLYYAKQPSGGTFTYSASESGLIHKSISVNTSNATNELGWIDIEFPTEVNYYLDVINITNNVTLYGIELKSQRTSGLRYDVFARNGSELADFIELDVNATEIYYEHFNPTVVFLKIGTNDAVTDQTSSVGYIALLTEYIRRILARTTGSTQIVLINPSQSSKHWTDEVGYKLLREYEEAEIAFCKANGYGFIDLPGLLGGNTTMAKKGGMLNILHPTQAGKQLEADAIMKYLEKNVRYNQMPYFSPFLKDKISKAKFELDQVIGLATISSNVKTQLVKYGLVGNISNTQFAYFDINITMGVYSALFVTNVKFQVHKDATKLDGEVSQLKNIVITALQVPSAFTITIDVELVANQLVISGTSNGFSAAGFTLDGTVTGYEKVSDIKKLVVVV